MPGIALAVGSIIGYIPGELGGRPRAPGGTRGEAALFAGALLGPHLGETSEIGLFFLEPGYPSLLSWFLLKHLFLPNLAINLLLHKDVSGPLVLHPPV